MRKLASILLRGRPLAFAVLALTLAGGAGLLFGSGRDVSAATKFTVFVGGGNAGISVDTYRPSVININEGDSIDFVSAFEEIHTVTFLGDRKEAPHLIGLADPIPGLRGPPRLQFTAEAGTPVPARGAADVDGTKYQSSGIMEKGQTWSVNFKKTGSFEFICIVHPLQKGTVNVLSAGIFVPSQATLNAEAARQLQTSLARAERATAAVTATKTGTTWESTFVNLPDAAVNRFLPARMQVAVGDTVVWKNDKPGAPHTVTFGMPPAPLPGEEEPVLPNAITYPVKPSQNYDGSAAFVNSGIIGLPPEGVGGTSFSLTFTKAGSYPYICVLHIDQGMAGVVIVGDGGGAAAGGVGGPGGPGGGAGGPGGPGGGPIMPPNTGDAGLAGDTSMMPWLLAAVAVLVLGLGGLAFAKAKLEA